MMIDSKKIFVILLMVVLSASCLPEDSMEYSKFDQINCALREDYIFIETAYHDVSTGEQTRRSFQFEKEGMVIRTHPIYYAPDYSDIQFVKYERQSESDEKGMLSARVVQNRSKTEVLGMVDKSCIENIETFLAKNEINIDLRKEIGKDKTGP